MTCIFWPDLIKKNVCKNTTRLYEEGVLQFILLEEQCHPLLCDIISRCTTPACYDKKSKHRHGLICRWAVHQKKLAPRLAYSTPLVTANSMEKMTSRSFKLNKICDNCNNKTTQKQQHHHEQQQQYNNIENNNKTNTQK